VIQHGTIHFGVFGPFRGFFLLKGFVKGICVVTILREVELLQTSADKWARPALMDRLFSGI